jgi:hypothetical protein
MGSWTCEKKSELKGALFIRILIPKRRGLDILTDLSSTRLQIAADKETSGRG